jgi:hypothetical protein
VVLYLVLLDFCKKISWISIIMSANCAAPYYVRKMDFYWTLIEVNWCGLVQCAKL